MKKSRLGILAFTFTMALGMPTAFAASVFDIRVSYYDTAAKTDAKKAKIAATFERFADAVYEMSNGVHRIGKVIIYTDGAYYDNADIAWRSGADGTECWFSADVNGRGHSGSHIVHCDNGSLPEGNGTIILKTLETPRASGYTLGHEWGHFFYGMFDEYKGDGSSCDASPCGSDVGVANSIMNDPLIAVNRSDDSMGYLEWLNFSTSLNNSGAINPATNKANNAQFRVYGASAWGTLVRTADQDSEFARQSAYNKARKYYSDLKGGAPRAGTAPSLEINTAEGQNAARKELKFQWKSGSASSPQSMPAGGSRVQSTSAGLTSKPPTARIIIVDNTTNVSAGMLKEVKATVQRLIALAEDNDLVRVVALDTPVLQVAPLTTLASKAAKDSMIQQVEEIVPGSSIEPASARVTELAADLVSLSAQLTDITTSVYVFANGYAANALLTGTTDFFRNSGMMPYTLDLGSDDAAGGLLRQFAEKTEGIYAPGDTPEKLRMAMILADMASSPSVDALLAEDQTVISGTQEFTFVVDPTLGEAKAEVSYQSDPSALSLSLIDPQGTNLPFAAEDCGVVRKAYDNTPAENTCIKHVNMPSGGVWKLRATSASSAVEMSYHIAGYPLDNTNVYFTTLDTIRSNDGFLLISAKVGNDLPLTGINVQAKVTKPDGTTVDVAMKDDGVLPDIKAQDGVYTGSLAAADDGDYLVKVYFNNAGGTGQYTVYGFTYASHAANQLIPMTQNFTRVALTTTRLLSSCKRVLNWAEALAAPSLLPMRGKQEMEIAQYQARYYPGTGMYLGCNIEDGNMYAYGPATGLILYNLGSLVSWLSQASAAGY